MVSRTDTAEWVAFDEAASVLSDHVKCIAAPFPARPVCECKSTRTRQRTRRLMLSAVQDALDAVRVSVRQVSASARQVATLIGGRDRLMEKARIMKNEAKEKVPVAMGVVLRHYARTEIIAACNASLRVERDAYARTQKSLRRARRSVAVARLGQAVRDAIEETERKVSAGVDQASNLHPIATDPTRAAVDGMVNVLVELALASVTMYVVEAAEGARDATALELAEQIITKTIDIAPTLNPCACAETKSSVDDVLEVQHTRRNLAIMHTRELGGLLRERVCALPSPHHMHPEALALFSRTRDELWQRAWARVAEAPG